LAQRHRIDDIDIIFGQQGRKDWGKYTFPVVYGLPIKVKWNKYEYDFNLRNTLKRISGRPPSWPNQLEQLKRTAGNDYIYYGIFGYEATYYMIKNYYVPFNGVSDPPVFNEEPFCEDHIPKALSSYDDFIAHAEKVRHKADNEKTALFLEKISGHNTDFLARDGERLHEIIGGRIPVLPPDTLEVDYEVVPVMIMDGCLYRCEFCCFKNHGDLTVRDQSDIRRQLFRLKDFYGDDLINYNSVVLGQNDALAAGEELVVYAAMNAYDILSLEESYHHGANLFMFASVDSLLDAGNSLFEALNTSHYYTHINIGLESPCQEGLDTLGKPIKEKAVLEAFQKAGDINKQYDKVRVTCNFVLGRSMPANHLESIKKLLSEAPVHSGKDTVYLSPIIGDCERMQIRNELTEIKRIARPEVFLYLVQCL